ncbi:sensor histidine kinase [Rufibacter latericius]|nr:histidine kinase [Rufibacter latericius]
MLHVVFWAMASWWFVQQANWVLGEAYPKMTLLVATGKMAFSMAFFYAFSYLMGKKMAGLPKAGAVVLLFTGAYVVYGLAMHATYTYLSATYPEVPGYVKILAKSVSTAGRWTFLQNPDVFYFHVQQLFLGVLVPLLAKGLRVVFQSRYRSMTLEKDNLKLELDFLRSQINPHFLFNTLNSVYALVEDKDQTAASVIYSLSNIMRFALYDANTLEVPVEKELETIRNYLDIQKVRHSRRLVIQWDIPAQVGHQLIPPLLLLTFVENAIKHGVGKYVNQSCVTIKAYRNPEQMFCFEVRNTLPSGKTRATSEGIGMANTRRRLDLLYPGRHSLDIRQAEEEFSVLLKIW